MCLYKNKYQFQFQGTDLLRMRESEQVLSDSVRGMFSPKSVEMILEHLETVRGLSRGQARLHGAVFVVLVDEAAAVLLEYVQVGDQLLLEVLLYGQQQDLYVHGFALQLQPVVLQGLDFVDLFLRQLDLELGQQRKCLFDLNSEWKIRKILYFESS